MRIGTYLDEDNGGLTAAVQHRRSTNPLRPVISSLQTVNIHTHQDIRKHYMPSDYEATLVFSMRGDEENRLVVDTASWIDHGAYAAGVFK